MVGDHFPPCVSDAHDMVLVTGALEGMAGALQEAVVTLQSSALREDLGV